MVNKTSKTAAELASENGKAEVAKLIAEYEADANIRRNIRSTTLDTAQGGADENGTDKEMATLHTAVEEGNIDVVKSLLERGADINSLNGDDKTPLAIAAYKGSVEVVRLLIERGAEVDSRDKWDWTALHEASRHGHVEVARILIDHGANVNARQKRLRTPINLSAANDQLDIVKLLLERGADVQAEDARGETPYQVLVQRGHREMADYLRRHGPGRERFDEILLWLRCDV